MVWYQEASQGEEESGQMNGIAIIATTYFPQGEDGQLRLEAALETLGSWAEHLVGGIDLLCIADDGSEPALHSRYVRAASEYSVVHGMAAVTTARRGVGASLNAGLQCAWGRGYDVIGYFVDDWALTADLDLRDWAKVLTEHGSLGMIRLGPPHPFTSGAVELFSAGWGLRLDRHGFAFGHRPALYHKRLFDAYGLFDEGCSALECERLYNEGVGADGAVPDIILALPHPWRHVDSVELSAVEPEGVLA